MTKLNNSYGGAATKCTIEGITASRKQRGGVYHPPVRRLVDRTEQISLLGSA